MGLRILTDGDNAVLFCPTSDWAFGPVFSGSDSQDYSAEDQARRFIEWFGRHGHRLIAKDITGRYNDPRSATEAELVAAYNEWFNKPAYFSEGDFAHDWTDTPEELVALAQQKLAEDGVPHDDFDLRQDDVIRSILAEGDWLIDEKKLEVAA